MTRSRSDERKRRVCQVEYSTLILALAVGAATFVGWLAVVDAVRRSRPAQESPGTLMPPYAATAEDAPPATEGEIAEAKRLGLIRD